MVSDRRSRDERIVEIDRPEPATGRALGADGQCARRGALGAGAASLAFGAVAQRGVETQCAVGGAV